MAGQVGYVSGLHVGLSRHVVSQRRVSRPRNRCGVCWTSVDRESHAAPVRDASARRTVLAGLVGTAAASVFGDVALAEEEEDCVVDYGRVLTTGERNRLSRDLAKLEAELGFKVRVLVQKRSGALIEPRTVWPLDDYYVVVLVDTLSGNIFDFRVGKFVREKLPGSFWAELQNRYGNKFYVSDYGEDVAVMDALADVQICLRKKEGCRQVPGFSRDQFALTAVVTAFSGVVAGLAPRQGGTKEFDVIWLFVFSPLWSFLLLTFGVGPIVQREGWLSMDLGTNLLIFLGTAVVSFFGSRRVFPPREPDSDS